MVLTKDGALNPQSGIKIIPYETITYTDKESPQYKEYQKYLKRFNELMDLIALEALS